MAKANRGGRRAGAPAPAQRQTAAVKVTPAAQAAPAPASAAPAPAANTVFGKMDDAYASKLRAKMDASYSSDVSDARKLYIANNNPNGDGFSMSQNLNYKLDNGLKLDASEAFIDKNIQLGMHPIGKDVTLTRYCHDDILQACGVKNYQKMTDKQLQAALVGTKFQTSAYTSYSYDPSKNPFRPGAPGGNGREVTILTRAKANTKMLFGARTQAEVIVNKGTKMVIKNVYYDGTTATPRGKGSRPRLVVEVETE